MKLPNFFKFAPLNDLKQRMGVPIDTYGSFAGDPDRITAEERVLLESGEGIEVSFDQLTVLPDKTLAYKDSRVLLYIRDVHVYGSRQREDWHPRYHLANCTTLQEMNAVGRFERYVIAAETSGEFILNMITGSKVRSERRQLSVCQNCLAGLAFDGFSFRKDRHTRANFVRSFTPSLFFAAYPQSLHPRKPRYTSATAPLDTYTDDFHEVSRRVREQVGWRCEGCRRDLAQLRLRQYLHVHHKSADRRDNRRSNLKALCIVCHAEQPRHAHLKSDPRYRAFLRELAIGADRYGS
jgi:hypothetical protein